jgi:hypothetical protein
MSIYKYLILSIYLLANLTACELSVLQHNVTYEQPLKLDVAEIPGKWLANGTRQLYGWGATSNAYVLSYATPLPKRLIMNLRYLEYSKKTMQIELIITTVKICLHPSQVT